MFSMPMSMQPGTYASVARALQPTLRSLRAGMQNMQPVAAKVQVLKNSCSSMHPMFAIRHFNRPIKQRDAFFDNTHQLAVPHKGPTEGIPCRLCRWE